jgi:8-oxo-dGTP pyrophosphatase MutT (NUDIX family)
LVDERSAGAVAFWGDPPSLLMIRDSFGRWTFPKGLIEAGETARQAALRELAEETGARGPILAELGAVRYFYTRPDRQIVRKRVWFYLVKAESPEVRPQLEEVHETAWFALGDAQQRLAYRNLQPVLGRAIRTLAAFASDK